MLPFLTLVALAAALMGMLNSLHHFFIPALSPAMFNVATILCASRWCRLPALGMQPITRSGGQQRQRWQLASAESIASAQNTIAR